MQKWGNCSPCNEALRRLRIEVAGITDPKRVKEASQEIAKKHNRFKTWGREDWKPLLHVHKFEAGNRKDIVIHPEARTVRLLIESIHACAPEKVSFHEIEHTRKACLCPEFYTRPTQNDDRLILSLFREEIDNHPAPAYLVNCTSHLVHMNPFVFKLPVPPQTKEILRTGTRLVDLFFDPRYPYMEILDNSELYRNEQMEQTVLKFLRFLGEPWMQDIVNELCSSEHYGEAFAAAWERAKKRYAEGALANATHTAKLPMMMTIDWKQLAFALDVQPVLKDERYFVIKWVSVNEAAAEQLVRWKQEIAADSGSR